MMVSAARRLVIGVGCGALAIIGPLVSVAGAAPSVGPNMAPVGHGIEATALPGATVFGTTPADTPESVSFILRDPEHRTAEGRRHPGRTGASSRSASSPRPTARARRRSTSSRCTSRSSASRPSAYADGLDVSATGTAGQFDQALAVQQLEYHVPGRAGHDGAKGIPAQTVHGPAQVPELPARIARSVLAVLGLTNYSPFTSHAVQVNRAVTGSQPSSANRCVRLTGTAGDCNLPTDFAADYGLTPLTQAGATGAGETLGIVTLAALDPGAPQYFWKHELGLPTGGRTVTVENVDGGSGAPSDAAGTGETDLDVEQSGGVATGRQRGRLPGAQHRPRFRRRVSSTRPARTWPAASPPAGASRRPTCRPRWPRGPRPRPTSRPTTRPFWSWPCRASRPSPPPGTPGPMTPPVISAVRTCRWTPRPTAPYLTAAGGTTLPWTGTLSGPGGSAVVTVPSPAGLGMGLPVAGLATSLGQSLVSTVVANVAGGGGGFSTIEPRPSYQQGVAGTSTYQGVEHLTPDHRPGRGWDRGADGVDLQPRAGAGPRARLRSGCARSVHRCRSVQRLPPLRAVVRARPASPPSRGAGAAPASCPPSSTERSPSSTRTSATGSDSSIPSIYPLATSAHSPFTPLQQSGAGNDNMFYTGVPGAPYNVATGLGTPNFSQLATDLKG